MLDHSGGISFQMIETDFSRCVAKVAVRVVQRDFERVFSRGLGELRTYNVSKLLNLLSGRSILGKAHAHMKVAEDLYHEIEGDREKADHRAHKGG